MEVDSGGFPGYPAPDDDDLAATEPAQLPRHPWFSMWVRPRATIRAILDTNPTYGVIVLASLSGVIDILNRAARRSAGDKIEFETILLGAITLGPLAGIAGVYIGGWLLRLTGGWLGGKGDARSLRAAIAWGGVPTLWAGLLWIPQLALIGEEMFTEQMPRTSENPPLLAFLLSTALVELVVAIWGFVVGLKAVGEAHRFSAWRALGASALAVALVLVPVALIIVAVLVLAA